MNVERKCCVALKGALISESFHAQIPRQNNLFNCHRLPFIAQSTNITPEKKDKFVLHVYEISVRDLIRTTLMTSLTGWCQNSVNHTFEREREKKATLQKKKISLSLLIIIFLRKKWTFTPRPVHLRLGKEKCSVLSQRFTAAEKKKKKS